MTQTNVRSTIRIAIEIAVYLLLVFALIAWCLQIVAPFITFLIWGTIIAVAAHKPFLKLRAAVGIRRRYCHQVFPIP